MSRFFTPFLSIFYLLSVSLGLIIGADAQTGIARPSEFTNPIISGFYPDPSICKVGKYYYLVNSTFAYFPGIPVFRSTDLVHWSHIGDVMNRPEQLDLDSAGVSRGLFAPAIRYNNGTFYITCTLVDKGGNFVVTAKDPSGPWSNPVWLSEVNGIDPSLFFDDDGKAYLVYNSIPPDDKPLYPGHRTIRIREFDAKKLEVSSDEKILINGGTDISKKPVWIEAPHIFKVKDYYYLFCAEGGTAYNHSEVVFRSKNVFGPYKSYKDNPILTQRTLNPDRVNPITSTGHADFVTAPDGSWWAVFLGCRPYRPYKKDLYNTGRETFMAPVKWIDANNQGDPGWPVINPGQKEVQYKYSYPVKNEAWKSQVPYSGNFSIKYDFNKNKLSNDWMFLRTPRENWYSLKERKGFLAIRLRPETCAGKMNPSFLGHRQQSLKGSASTTLSFKPKSANEKAGLLIFQNENHFYFLCESIQNGEPAVQLYKSVEQGQPDTEMQLLASEKLGADKSGNELLLKISSDGGLYSFYYSLVPGKWKALKEGVDGTYLSTGIAGGFVGCVYALYATSLGKESSNSVYYDWFEYKTDDDVYK